jgi:hypothetical protein
MAKRKAALVAAPQSLDDDEFSGTVSDGQARCDASKGSSVTGEHSAVHAAVDPAVDIRLDVTGFGNETRDLASKINTGRSLDLTDNAAGDIEIGDIHPDNLSADFAGKTNVAFPQDIVKATWPIERYQRLQMPAVSFIWMRPIDERDDDDDDQRATDWWITDEDGSRHWESPNEHGGVPGLKVTGRYPLLYVAEEHSDDSTINTDCGEPIYQSNKRMACDGLRLLERGTVLRLDEDAPEQPEIKPVPSCFLDEQDAALIPSLWRVEKPTFLLGHLLASDMRTMFYGVTGAGKTTVALHMAAHVAAGRRFLRWDAPVARKVLYLDGEMPRYGMQTRYQQALSVLGVERLDNLRVANRVQMGYPPIDTADGQRWLNELIEAQGGFDLIVFDNLKSLVRASLISEGYWTELQPLVLDFTKRGIGQLWVHHASNHNPSQFFGSDTPSWQLDTVMRLARFKSATAPLALAVTFDKARWSDLAPEEFDTSKIELSENGVWAGSAVADTVKTHDADLIEAILEQADVTAEPGWTDRQMAEAMCPHDPGSIIKTVKRLSNARRTPKLYERVLHMIGDRDWRWFLSPAETSLS